MPESRIIDAHAHLWDPRTTPRAVTPLVKLLGFNPRLLDWVAPKLFPREAVSFFASPKHITRRYVLEDYAQDAHPRVQGLVHVEAGWEGKGPAAAMDETRWLSRLAEHRSGRIMAIVAQAELRIGASVLEILRSQVEANPRVRGVRYTTSWHPSPHILNGHKQPELLSDVVWRAGFEQLTELKLSFDATVYNNQLSELTELALAYPSQRIVLCHMGTPIAFGGPYGDIGNTIAERQAILGRWKDAMSRLKECPNVYVKLSGLCMPICGFGWEHQTNEPSASEVCDALSPLVDFAIDAFGPARCMFGSNFPIDKVSVSYTTLVEGMLQILQSRNAAERELILSGTAQEFYRCEPPAAFPPAAGSS